MTMSEAVMFARINGEGEARRQMGLSYTKIVPVPNTLAGTADLILNREKYGLTDKEVCTVLDMNSKRYSRK